MSSSTASLAPSWEAQKENAAPLERGRNVASIGLRQSDVDREELSKKVREYEALVRPSEDPSVKEMDNDPLSAWLAYIKFYQNSFPSDTRDNFLIIERCVRALAKMKQYNNDDRFVSVCAKYADKTKDPGQVFKYLHSQKIGGHVAIFWIAWAFVAEKESDFPFAEQIFKKGLSKKAEPLQMLKLRHQQFQRRMSRHWLNNSRTNDQLNDEYDTGEQNRSSRATLGGISSDRLRRNDRSQHRVRQGSTARRQNSSRRFGGTHNNSNTGSNPKGAFNIFVEEDGENANYLDQEYAERERAVIAKDSDRRKENLATAERWNERGGIQRTFSKSKASAPRSKTPLAAFSVFVDEECAAKNEREEQEQEAHVHRQRQVRDERTFRERDNDGMAEQIFRDPVRFLKDPDRYKSEVVKDQKKSEDQKADAQRKSRAGFNKKLLKDKKGVEQCFEEARAKAGGYKLIQGSSMNFNELQRPVNLNQSSNMSFDSDSEASIDISMSESASEPAGSKKPFGDKQFQTEASGKKSFERFNGSFDAGLNQTAISHASSTINEIDIGCGGVFGKKEREETINTKFAMKELSMMFSSPACEAESGRRRNDDSNASRINESLVHVGQADTSFGHVGDGILLDNSICNSGSEKIHYEKRPFAERSTSKGFSEGAKSGGGGFVIFQEDPSVDESKVQNESRPGSGFQIFQEGSDDSSHKRIEASPKATGKSSFAFQIYEGDVDNDKETDQSKFENGDTASISDAIALLDEKLDINDSNSSSSDEESHRMHSRRESEKIVQSGFPFQIYADGSGDDDQNSAGNGDTASISDAIAMLDDKLGTDDLNSSSSDEESQNLANPEDETATMSLFNEIFQDQLDERKPARSGARRKVTGSTTGRTPRERLKRPYDEVQKSVFNYDTCIAHASEQTLRDLKRNADNPDPIVPFVSRLFSKGKTLDLPSVLLPKQLRRKRLVSDSNVLFGKHGGLFVKKELGRGTFGRVILVNTTVTATSGTVAIKVQSPTHSLAWEFVVLQRLERRLLRNMKQSDSYTFPRPINFISLADGGILSMSAASETGLTLVDLSNFYKLKLGESVPELIAFHYTAAALRIIEQLHLHGKILHCDVKPDNFVLSSSNSSISSFPGINFSDLTLVDFGSAIDLAQNPDDIFLSGTAAKKDMQCIAMRNGRSWSYDADTFGVLCCAHVLLYGKHMELKNLGDNRWMPSFSLKRYWKRDLWKEIVQTLLTPDDSARLSIGRRGSTLQTLIQKIEAHLKTEARSLHKLLSRQANILPDNRSKII